MANQPKPVTSKALRRDPAKEIAAAIFAAKHVLDSWRTEFPVQS